jgi:hypothetical protein
MAPNSEHHYDSQTYASDRATNVHRAMQHMPDEDRTTRSELQASIADDQSAQLASQVRMGDDRAIGSTPNWSAMTSTQLYTAATQRNSPDTADSLGRAFNEGGNRLADAANRLLDAVGKLDAAWSGKAADAARGALTPLAESAGQAGLAAQLMGAQMARQTAAAQEVRKLPPPKEFDYQAELTAALANPNPIAGLADMQAKKVEADAVKREQVAFLETYTQTMSAVDGQMPSFIEPTTRVSGGDGGGSHLSGSRIDYHGPIGGSPNQNTSTGAPTGQRIGVGAPSAGFGPQPGGDGTDGQDFGPLPSLGGINTGASGYAPTPTATPNLAGGSPAGGVHPSVPGAGSGGFGSGFGSFGGGAPGSASGGPGGGGPGSGGGSAARGPAGGVGGPETAAARGMAVPARGPIAGQGMGAGGGRGRGKGEEDDEHERPSYLIEADPDSTFGTNEVSAPPVIGQE